MILYVNACVRTLSRTDRVARELLKILGKEYKEVKLAKEDIRPLDEATLEKRTALAQKNDFRDSLFSYAKDFAAADTIVVSAPFWDGSFPSILKVYLENVYVIGLTSKYLGDGTPVGLCRAKKLYYVTTAGGKFIPDFSYDYLKALATTSFGIPETILIKAEFLDVYGADEQAIIEKTINSLRNEP